MQYGDSRPEKRQMRITMGCRRLALIWATRFSSASLLARLLVLKGRVAWA